MMSPNFFLPFSFYITPHPDDVSGDCLDDSINLQHSFLSENYSFNICSDIAHI